MAQRIFTLILLLCSTSAFAGLFDAPGRSQFVPADRAFVFDFQQNQHDLTLSWQVKRVTTFTVNKSASRRRKRISPQSNSRQASGMKMSFTEKAKSTVNG